MFSPLINNLSIQKKCKYNVQGGKTYLPLLHSTVDWICCYK